MDTLLAIIAGIIGLIIYFCPSFVGAGKRNHTSIVILNLFLGWTIVGWIVALVWANSNDTPVQRAPVPSTADELYKLKQLLDSGAITSAEYDFQKAKLIR